MRGRDVPLVWEGKGGCKGRVRRGRGKGGRETGRGLIMMAAAGGIRRC